MLEESLNEAEIRLGMFLGAFVMVAVWQILAPEENSLSLNPTATVPLP